MKIFVEALDREGVAFLHRRNKFKHISEAKVKEGVFISPQIKAVFRDEEFEKKQKQEKQPGWHSNQCAHISLEIGKLKTMKILLVTCSRVIGCNMSLKLHVLDSHLNFFPQNLGANSDEHGKRFHQDISMFEKCFSRRWNRSLLAEYFWSVFRDTQSDAYKRKRRKKIILVFVFSTIKPLLNFYVTNLYKYEKFVSYKNGT
ncbi:hypothetical protein AVEN_229597-1 [Araneus ventricosus]|uniref:Uncharacterized protein n=1 Tax=Araneus ventricosus TaxID=182803 RepID=A0A4Y2DA99_ARAVE|nr:hypothetical protein AVEN_229597-1 [Araneus ventricosus]